MHPSPTAPTSRFAWLFVSLSLLLPLGLTACSGGDAPPGGDGLGSDVVQGDAADATDTDAKDTDAPDVIDPDVYTWPVALEPLTVAPSPQWRAELEVPADGTWLDPFIAHVDGEFGHKAPRWSKATVVLSDPSKVYFQHGAQLPFHNDFVRAHLPPWKGASDAAIGAVALHESGQKIAFAVVLMPPDASVREFGVQLIRDDPIHPEMVRRLFETIVGQVRGKQGETLAAFYMPAVSQQATAKQFESWLAERGVPLGQPARWGVGSCYADGWAVGRLVQATAATLPAKVAAGEILATDILLLDAVPAEVPIVAGLLTEEPTTPSSHAALLAQNLGVPFAPLPLDDQRAAAKALVGKTVVLRARSANQWEGGCDVLLRDASALGASKDALLALKTPAVLEVPAMQAAGAQLLDTKLVGKGDAAKVGGKAAGYGVLRAALPGGVRHAAALTFDVWNAFLDAPTPADSPGKGAPLRAALAAELAGLAWPVAPQALAAHAAACRALVLATPWPKTLGDGVVAALAKADFTAPDQGSGAAFSPTMKLRFRSSTNVEDSATFSGAGLYDSVSGCLQDDLDADAKGPSACDLGAADERGALRAIRKVYASFYNDNALGERLRHKVDEAKVGMAVLVHRSFPDEAELANGVVTMQVTDWSTNARVVSQIGALSVTNAAPGAEPELVDLYIGKSGEASPTFVSASTVVPLGAKVMAWPTDYVALGEQLRSVATAWKAASGEQLDLEFKRVDTPSGAPAIVIKQVRPLAKPAVSKTAPYLLGDSVSLCTFEGESGDVWEIARAKVRLTLQLRAGRVDSFGAAGLFAQLAMRHRGPGGTLVETKVAVDASGKADVAGWSVSKVPTPGWDPPVSDIVHSFQAPGPAGTATWTLRARVADSVAVQQALLTAQDLQWELSLEHATPQPFLDWDAKMQVRSKDHVRLWPCAPTVAAGTPPLPGAKEVERSATGPGGVSMTSRFWWPAAPKGPTAGYTAPNVLWVQTTLSGWTSTPLVLTSPFAQHQRPGHHNFDGMYVFEPRLDVADTFDGRSPSVTAAQLAELDKAGIVAIYVHAGADIENTVWIGKADGSWSKAGAN